MDIKELKSKMEAIHSDIRTDYANRVNRVDSVLFLFMGDGGLRILDVEKMADRVGVSPGAIVEGFKERLKADSAIIGTMFVAEAWMLKADVEKEPSASQQAVIAGNKSVSDCDDKQESLILAMETRDGHVWMYMHEIKRDNAGNPRLIHNMESIDDTQSGRLVGVFN